MSDAPAETGVLLLCHNRPIALARTLTSLFAARAGGMARPPVTVSCDSHHPGVKFVLKRFAGELRECVRSSSELAPDLAKRLDRRARGYARISSHYREALHHMFDVAGYRRVIVVEDDMLFASDFFDYFATLAPLLDDDPGLLCVSAWNDLGQRGKSQDPTSLYRTDCFPGLGWMLTRDRWQELQPWPELYWDDWLRRPEQTRGRTSIFPEVNRTYTFGRRGTSDGQFFTDYLEPICLNEQTVDWGRVKLDHLKSAAVYDEWLARELTGARVVRDWKQLDRHCRSQQAGAFSYFYSPSELPHIMREYRLMPDLKSGRARGSYAGLLVFRHLGCRVFLCRERRAKRRDVAVSGLSLTL